MNPYFTIIIPTYNRAEMIASAIESILRQTFIDWELIIVDDGSTDDTRESIAKIKDNRIKYLYQRNRERSSARNLGIDNAKGKYICFLDSDDYFLPQRLELFYGELNKHNEPVAMFYTGISFEKDGVAVPRNELIKEDQSIFNFVINATIGVPQTCIHTEILKRHKFNATFHIGEDLELWLRIVNEYPLIYLDSNNTVVAREHDERSVNLKNYNSGKEELRMLKFIFTGDHPGNKVSRIVCKQKISNAYFSMARYYIYNGRKRIAAVNLIRSIFTCGKHSQTKHKIYLLLHLLTGGKIREYSK